MLQPWIRHLSCCWDEYVKRATWRRKKDLVLFHSLGEGTGRHGREGRETKMAAHIVASFREPTVDEGWCSAAFLVF